MMIFNSLRTIGALTASVIVSVPLFWLRPIDVGGTSGTLKDIPDDNLVIVTFNKANLTPFIH